MIGHNARGEALPKVKLEMVIAAERVEQVIETLTNAARSGKIGDGKIFVSTIDDAVRIRNGERGTMAL